jgi:glycosyltransferase involved in cell wall biosynthesis
MFPGANVGAHDPLMKVLIVVPWDEEPGGVVSVAENLASYLQDKGHEVLFFHPGPNVLLRTGRKRSGFLKAQLRLGFPFAQPRPLVSAIAFPFLSPIVLAQLLWFLIRRRIQIVNIHYPIDNFFYFALCRHLLGVPLVSSLHGADAFQSDGTRKNSYTPAFRLLIHSSDRIILPSDTYRSRFADAFPRKSNKTISIHNGVDTSRFVRSPNPLAAAEAERYLLSIAALYRWKGVDLLLRAAQPLLAADRALRLVIAGDGPLRAELESQASALGIGEQTRFLGTTPPMGIVTLLHGCEIFVLPSREESFGLVVIEAMACAKPVVATAVGGVPEIVEHEKTGILVKPDDPEALTEGLRRLLGSRELRQTVAENGHKRVLQSFSFARTGAAYEAAFTSLIRGFRS